MLILWVFTSEFWQQYNTLGGFLPYFHCTCAETAIWGYCVKLL